MGLERIAEFLRKLLMIFAAVALLGVTLLATLNVVLRVFRVPVSGTYEIVSFLGAIVTAGALGYTQKHRNHIVVDILSEKYSPGLKRAVDRLSYAIMFLFFCVVSWQTMCYGRRLVLAGEVSETLKIPFQPFVYAVAIGFGVFALTILLDLVEMCRTEAGKQ